MIDSELLQILCCPETHQALAVAPPELLSRLNERALAGGLRNRAGQLIQEPLEAGLIRDDRRYLYPVRHRIPIMLVDEAIPLEGVG